MSLWGSKNKDNDPPQDQEPDDGQVEDMPRRSGSSRRRDPTERDRLLPPNPRPPHADGYLDPDDPAVSAYEANPSHFNPN